MKESGGGISPKRDLDGAGQAEAHALVTFTFTGILLS
jgi:hypothetical protein